MRTKTTKRSARMIVEKYYSRLTSDFQTNKRVCEEVALIPTKRLRNKIAGYITVSPTRHRQQKTTLVVCRVMLLRCRGAASWWRRRRWWPWRASSGRGGGREAGQGGWAVRMAQTAASGQLASWQQRSFFGSICARECGGRWSCACVSCPLWAVAPLRHSR